MAAGQSGKKTGAIIQARMQSARLPGKIILPIPPINGKPLLQSIIDSLKESLYIDEIILATSTHSENDVLENIASVNNIRLIRGSESDVLSRFVSAIKKFELQTIVRVTADNPILDPRLLDKLLLYHNAENNDYTHSSNLPLGMNLEIVGADVLKEISVSPDLTKEDREHVTFSIGSSKEYKSGMIPLWPESLTDKIRLTVDYPVDYALICLLFNISLAKGIRGMELVNWVDNNQPWIWEINNQSYQKKQYASFNEELDIAVKMLNDADLLKAAKLLQDKRI